MSRDTYLAAAAIFAGAVVSLAAGGWLGVAAAATCGIGLALLLHDEHRRRL